MLRMIALTAAVAFVGSVAPLPGTKAEAGQETYRSCVRTITTYCHPNGPDGPTLPPEEGQPGYEAYQACLATRMAYCETLPGAPGA